MTLLKLENVFAGYGAGDVVRDASLEVNEGEIVVILGANGAGKTTLMRAISGLIARRGRITFDGSELTRLSPDKMV